jgi:hypothetical protein
VQPSTARPEKVMRTREPQAAEPYEAPPDLSPAQRRALDDLRERGVATTTFDELVGDDGLWQELESDMEDYVARAERLAPKLPQPERKDEFLIRRWTPDSDGNVVDDPRIPLDSPWLRFAASDVLLDVVNSYLGVYTVLSTLDNWYTVAFPESAKRVASQRWHRDPEDVHVVKCFLYFSDVDGDAGPFEYIPGSVDGSRYGDVWKWGTEKKWYPPDEVLDQRIPASERIQLTGPRGTLILCDRGGFHRGGHARAKPRVLETHTYISPASEWRKLYHEVVWRDGVDFSRQSRYALT